MATEVTAFPTTSSSAMVVSYTTYSTPIIISPLTVILFGFYSLPDLSLVRCNRFLNPIGLVSNK